MESEGWFRLGFVFGNVFFIFCAKKKKVERWRRRVGGGWGEAGTAYHKYI